MSGTHLNLQRTVARFSSPLTRRRFGANTIDGGYAGNPTYTDTTINGYVSPVPGHMQRTLPESIRESIIGVLYTNDDIRTAQQATGLLGDDVQYNGNWYNCREVKDRILQGLYNCAYLQRLGTAP